MYGMAGYSHMGVPVDMAHGGHGLGDNSQDSVLDWIAGISQAVGTVVGAVTGKPPVVYGSAPVVTPKPAQASLFGFPMQTVLLVGGVVVVGTLLMNRKRR